MNPAETKIEIERQIAAIDALINSEGWQLLRAALDSSEVAAYEAMLKAPSSETAKHFGGYNAIRDIKDWPLRQRTILVHRLKTGDKGSPRLQPIR